MKNLYPARLIETTAVAGLLQLYHSRANAWDLQAEFSFGEKW